MTSYFNMCLSYEEVNRHPIGYKETDKCFLSVFSLAYKGDTKVTITFTLVYKEYIRDERRIRAHQVV